MVCVAHQEEVKSDGTPASVASALLAALHAPLYLEWTASVGDKLTRIRAEISKDLATWPPPKVTLQITSGNNVIEVKIPSKATPEQLEVVLRAGTSVAGKGAMEEKHLSKVSGCTLESSPQKQNQHSKPQVIDTFPGKTDSRKLQLACIDQWHHDMCGHHALFSTRCLVQHQPSLLLDEDFFWGCTLRSISALSSHGESTGRWPKSRVIGGVADECHLQHLVDSDVSLKDSITVVQAVEQLRAQLLQPSSSASQGLAELRQGKRKAHGFLLGGAVHWYAATAVREEERGREPHLIFCDSYNRPMAHIPSDEEFEALVEERLDGWREWSVGKLGAEAEWKHRTEEDVRKAVESGVEEWWKGHRKSSLFWRFQPASVKREILRQELGGVRAYLDLIGQVLWENDVASKPARDGGYGSQTA
eukprot:CAMPEP_0197626068 /NCGR_PEP_ID=MMETSP1338-20131121/5210_1 /TAXON_ID=43686 ORGANISM="Pelagodinium beii, Strain RCC1491" /NCGR_SAMPLE_ID=MMETSP1338 /ASSEMBLY_ACC=CAM_ASM_000754 /LENGTH=417 /DNA_ID=CAMNT_0043196585 /DNA_START=48 /DNA_END=1297 /DNA_ORIENTATION=+